MRIELINNKFLMNGLRIFLIIKCIFRKDQEFKKFLGEFYTPQDWTKEQMIDPIIALVKN